jgi:hypothetical protein
MTISNFSLAKPTETDLIASLRRVMGDKQAQIILDEAKESCGPDNPGDPLLALTKVAMWLSRQKGIASVVGQSLAIRIKFYNSIYKNEVYERN